MRALLDTNILARPAYTPSGPAGEVLHTLSKPPHVLILSSFILQELHRILRYPRLRQLHQLSDGDIDSYIAAIETAGVLVDPQPHEVIEVVPADPDDDMVIATTVVGNADVLCTLDRHIRHADVRQYCSQHGIEVMTDVELLQELRKGETPDEPIQ